MSHQGGLITDEDLAAKVQNGDPDAFGQIVERYAQKMLRYAGRFLFGYRDAEDVVQEVFINAFVNIQGYSPQKSFSSWIYRIAHNRFVDEIRKAKREPLPFFDSESLFPHPISTTDLELESDRAALKAFMEQHLDKLNPKYREPLVLFYFEGLGYAEIAEILRIPTSTVGVRLNRGKAEMKKMINRGVIADIS
jgi:RNA polymerase sigma-70 factor (ECF subfamily)